MKKYLGLTVGIGACSMASHCMAYGVLGSRISEGGVRTWLAVLAVVLFFAGAGMITSVLYLYSSGQLFRKTMGGRGCQRQHRHALQGIADSREGRGAAPAY